MAVDERAVNELLGGAGVVAHLQGVAQQVADEVVRIAPRHTGTYDESIGVGEPYVDNETGLTVVPVETTDPFWHIVEFGSVNSEVYAPMRRALANLRIKTRQLPKP